MKRRIKTLLSILAAAALTAGLLAWVGHLTERKSSENKYAPFFDQTEDFDVLFLGSSHVLNGVFPMELWQDYGIVSYNLGGHGSLIPEEYWVLRCALRHTTPKLVVADCYFLSRQTKLEDYFTYCHYNFDALPLTWTKIQAVWDLLDDPVFDALVADGTYDDEPGRSRMSLLWDFSVYHDRWKELGRGDFVPAPTREKGAESRVGVARPRGQSRSEQTLSEQTTAMEYLRRIIQCCQDRGIDVLLTYLPFPAGEADWQEANTAGRIAAEYGLDYINFLDLDVVDPAVDYYDSTSHLNPSGARKVTDYLGGYIQAHYAVPNRREDPDYAGWDADYGAYMAYKLELLDRQEQLKNYLMLLQDEHLSAVLYLDGSGLWTGPYRALLENMGADPDALPAGEASLTVVDRLSGTVTCLEAGESVPSCFGRVSLERTEEGACRIRIGDRDVLTPAANAAAGAWAVNDADGTLSAPAQFAAAAEPARLDG